MINIKNLTFQYNDSKEAALRDVSLDVKDGDFLGIIGTSGAGKTTLALAINGIVPHEFKGDFYGEVIVNGKDTVDNSPEEFCPMVAEVFQNIDSQMVASVVEDEILFGLENFGIPHEEIGRRLDKVLDELGIADLRTREISSLSGGQKQKVAIASILALEPEIMVLDEPTGELDPESSIEIFELLKKLNEEKGITIVVVEQKIMLLCKYAKHLVVLENGEKLFDGTAREAVSNIKLFKEAGINVPPVATLATMLKDDNLYDGEVPLDTDEAEIMVKKVLKND